MIAESHLADRFRQPEAACHIDGDDTPGLNILAKGSAGSKNRLIIRHQILVLLRADPDKPAARRLQFRRHHIPGLRHIHRERNQRRRHVNPLEGSGHRVLASDRRQSEAELRVVGAQKGRKRLAPALRILRHPAEIFLECEPDLRHIASGRRNFHDRRSHRPGRSVIRAPAHQVRIKAVGHHGHGMGPAARHGNLRNHRLRLGELIFSAVRHQRRGGADRAVEHLHKPALRADVEIAEHLKPAVPDRLVPARIPRPGLRIHLGIRPVRDLHENVVLLMRAVCIQKSAGDVHNFPSAPGQHQPRLARHARDRRSLQILGMGEGKKSVDILRIHHDGHPLLRFGNREFRSVKPRIFLRHLVEVDPEPVRQLANCDGNAAGAEIIALFHETGDFFPTEEPLKLPLGGCISLLHLGAACLRGLKVMRLGGPGSASNAVPACPAAEQNDHVSRIGGEPSDRPARRGAHHSADFQPFGNIVGVIDFLHVAGRQSDLVAVGAVAVRRLPYQLFLRQFSGKRLALRHRRIRGSSDAHRLIDVGPPRKRIADRAAEAGRRTAERLDLGRMIMRLVLEIDQPLLILPVHVNRRDDGAGVDLVRLLLILKLSFSLQLLRTLQRQIHQGNVFVVTAPVQFPVILQIPPVCLLDGRAEITLSERHVLQFREEGGVAAVVRPVGIQHPDLRHRRVPVLLVSEICLNEPEIVRCHGQPETVIQLLQRRFFHRCEAGQRLHILRLRIFRRKSRRLHLVRDP